jgi:hypothetical protein
VTVLLTIVYVTEMVVRPEHTTSMHTLDEPRGREIGSGFAEADAQGTDRIIEPPLVDVAVYR